MACMTVRSTAALPSGQGSEGVPRAAASAAPTRQEQVHEGEPEPGERDYEGPRHDVGPRDDMGPHDVVDPSADDHVGPLTTQTWGPAREPQPAHGPRTPAGPVACAAHALVPHPWE